MPDIQVEYLYRFQPFGKSKFNLFEKRVATKAKVDNLREHKNRRAGCWNLDKILNILNNFG